MRVRAVWNGATLADSDQTVVVEGNHYFPPESVSWEYFTGSKTHTVCFWKGLASYHTITVEDQPYPDAAWYYPHPSPLARKIKNRIAFGYGVQVQAVAEDE